MLSLMFFAIILPVMSWGCAWQLSHPELQTFTDFSQDTKNIESTLSECFSEQKNLNFTELFDLFMLIDEVVRSSVLHPHDKLKVLKNGFSILVRGKEYFFPLKIHNFDDRYYIACPSRMHYAIKTVTKGQKNNDPPQKIASAIGILHHWNNILRTTDKTAQKRSCG